MKEIVVFFPSFNVGGVEKVMITLANELVKYGFSVDVIVANDSGDLKSLLNQNIKITSLGNVRLRYCIHKYIKHLRRLTPNLIISAPNIPNILSIAASKLLNIDCIVTQHCFFDIELKRMGFIGKIVPKMVRLMYNSSSHVVAVSNSVRMMLCRLGISPNLITKIYNPIDIDYINNKASEDIGEEFNNEYIIYAGRLDYVKNVELVINAFELIAEDTRLDLLILGNGTERDRLQNIVESKGLNNRIKFVGFKANPYPYIKNAKLLTLPSYSESFGNIVIEAMSLGVTSVCTPTEGVIEITDNGKYAYMSNSFDNKFEFAKKILEAYRFPKSPNTLKNIANKYDATVSANQYVKLINSLLSARKQGRVS